MGTSNSVQKGKQKENEWKQTEHEHTGRRELNDQEKQGHKEQEGLG